MVRSAGRSLLALALVVVLPVPSAALLRQRSGASPPYWEVRDVVLAAPERERDQSGTFPPLVWTDPTGQPPTAAQDAQRCGTLKLPARLQLVARVPERLHRVGRWETMDSATLATWDQSYYGWSPNNIYYSRGSMPLFQMIDIGNHTLSLDDCEGTRQYKVQRVKGGVDIMDSEDAIVARGRYNVVKHFPDQMLFMDQCGDPIAVAESPAVQVVPSFGDWTHQMRVARDEVYNDKESMDSNSQVLWQVVFYDGSATNSTLIHTQHRWVVTAAVQELALYEEGHWEELAYLRPWLIVAWLLVVTVVIFAFGMCYYKAFIPSRQLKSQEEKCPIKYDTDGPRDYGGLRGRLPGHATFDADSPP